MPSEEVGFIAVAIAILFFGSNFVPIKKFKSGDGMFFQWILCIAIWVVGCTVNVIRTSYESGLTSSTQFYPYAMLGGFFWTIGNVMVVPIIKCIGLGLGMCIWGSVNLLFGWASGTFGLFGIIKQRAPRPALNYAGVAIAIIGVIAFVFVESESQEVEEKKDEESTEYLLNSKRVDLNTVKEESFVDRLAPPQKRILGVVLSVISGFFYGINFDPPTYIIDKNSGHGIDFAFSHFSGILFTSTALFAIYCAYKRNKPAIYPELILPALASGIMWAIAQSAFFVANDNLQLIISFPLIATGPGLVASLWGVFVFKEIRGKRNYAFLTLGFTITIIAVILITLSKV